MLAGGGMAIKPEGEYGFFACRAFFCGFLCLLEESFPHVYVSYLKKKVCVGEPEQNMS